MNKPLEPKDGPMVMDRLQVRAFDTWAINQLGLPGVVLMENAGRGCAERLLARLGDPAASRVVVLCGPGNNGGDGYVTARHLTNAGVHTETVICGDRERVRGDARVHLDVLERMGAAIRTWAMVGLRVETVREALSSADWVVDALFGTGLTGPVRAGYDVVIEALNQMGKPVLAVDIPSGLDCDTGRPLGPTVKATLTVTFVAVKEGFARAPDAAAYTGGVEVASIGIAPRLWPALPK
ncbi:MAG TPA: NAD(P)H-hydrate epimerase [Phycisphaerales bacterium]|nr:NAD(P)H-hydrate epimerase [Phycisphaerales bacterium]